MPETDFNLLIVQLVIRVAQPSAWLHHFSELECWNVSELSGFLENDKMDLCRFFSGFRRKHLFTTTCIKKHCTWPF